MTIVLANLQTLQTYDDDVSLVSTIYLFWKFLIANANNNKSPPHSPTKRLKHLVLHSLEISLDFSHIIHTHKP
ncbi:hypothetical protein L2E82_49362 [Cichorium intybus]|uniref:Uncharacterized protein n=1 Tax=Cichorium intybus TaxID=13427 RepID=A0ACB8Z0G5_CICIN|nr:hypothetical protein L2E82_49362 [Cichorium intybus]